MAIDLRRLPRSASHTDFLDHLTVGKQFTFTHTHGRVLLRSIGIVTAVEPGGPLMADVARVESLPSAGRVRVAPGSAIDRATKPVRKGMPEIRHDRFAIVVEHFTSGLAVEVHGPVTAVIADGFKVGDQWFDYRQSGRTSLTIHASA